MGTKRTPFNRAMRRRISPRALDLFRSLKRASAGDEWWAIHNDLHDELGCKPWQWPCVENPDAERNYEPAADALALWAELEAAAGQ